MQLSFRSSARSTVGTFPRRIVHPGHEANPMVLHVDNCFNLAEQQVSKINEDILNLHGMSGYKTRHLYNNLLTLSDARYLEIGVWKGSTVCSAMFKNDATVVCIDNFCEFGGPKDEFLVNFNRFKGENDATFIESDCFKVDITTLPKFNIYLYDGNHDHDSHYKALSYFMRCLDDMFIYIVDDWNWESVRTGTYAAIQSLGLQLLYSREVRTSNDNSHPNTGSAPQKEWHNGVFVAVVKK